MSTWFLRLLLDYVGVSRNRRVTVSVRVYMCMSVCVCVWRVPFGQSLQSVFSGAFGNGQPLAKFDGTSGT